MTKTLAIGLDSADKSLILEWAREGSLPTFRRLLELGAWGTTWNPPGLYVGSVWPTFFTGVSPARHGRYSDHRFIPGTYETTEFRPSDLAARPFWEALSDAGKRVAVIDVPAAPLSRNLNGIHVVDWGTHDPEEGFMTHPPSLASTLEAAHGLDPVGQCDYGGRGPGDFPRFRDGLIRRIETKTSCCRELLAGEDWDLFLVCFSECHCVGHQCWHLHDPDHPRHDAALAQSMGDPVKDVYVATDRAIGRLLESAGSETPVVLFSSLGMGPNYSAGPVLDKILRKMEQSTTVRSRVHALLFRLWKQLPMNLRKHLNGVKKQIRNTLLSPDRAGRKCFALPANGAVRINLVDREPKGLIGPGPEYDAFCESLSRDLLAIKDAHTGTPLVRRVHRTDEFYARSTSDSLPDLLVEWNTDTLITSIESEKIGHLDIAQETNRTGDHLPEGMLVVVRPGIPPGQLQRPISVVDVAPTLAAYLGVSLEDIDGVPIQELL